MTEIYVAEYSISQGAWNIDTLNNIIEKNNEMRKLKINNDYKIIFVDIDENKLRKKVEETIKEEE